jgi:hypothetical protein
LRVQVLNALESQLGPLDDYLNEYGSGNERQAYDYIVDRLRDEHGVRSLTNPPLRNKFIELRAFVETEADVDRVLDAIELGCRVVEVHTSAMNYRNRAKAREEALEAIERINRRFAEHGVGYRYEGEEIIRVDSALVHAEAVVPALRLLNNNGFSGAEEEFHLAYEHFRHDRPKEALNEALKALESTLKVICDKSGWAYAPGDTAKRLLDVCFASGLVPEFWQSHMSALRATLEAGVPTARNKLGGHGQGAVAIQVPTHLVAYVLHMTASAIVFLVEAHQAQASSTSGRG